VWEIRIWDTKPQLRLFGRFAAKDVFVALIGPVGRFRITWQGFEQIKLQCISQWQQLFGTEEPVTKGDDIDAYISNVTVV
jgi:hypothetical protein